MNKFLQGPFAKKKTGSRLLRAVSLLFLSWGYACLSWPCGESRRQFWAGSLLGKKKWPIVASMFVCVLNKAILSCNYSI